MPFTPAPYARPTTTPHAPTLPVPYQRLTTAYRSPKRWSSASSPITSCQRVTNLAHLHADVNSLFKHVACSMPAPQNLPITPTPPRRTPAVMFFSVLDGRDYTAHAHCRAFTTQHPPATCLPNGNRRGCYVTPTLPELT